MQGVPFAYRDSLNGMVYGSCLYWRELYVKKKVWMILILGILLAGVCLAVFFWPYITAARQFSHVEDILEECSFDVQYHIGHMQQENRLWELLNYMEISAASGKVAGERDEEIIHLTCYPEGEAAALEAYGDTADIMINIKPVYEYLRTHGRLSGLVNSILPEMTEDGYVSFSRFTGEGKKGIEIPDALLSRIDWETALALNRCDMPADSVFANSLQNMYFYSLTGAEGEVYLLGIDKQVQKNVLNCYVRISSPQLEAEALVTCKEAELSLIMPGESLSSWQLQFIEWLGELLRR